MTQLNVNSVEDFATWLIKVRQETDAVWILMQEWEAYCNSTTSVEVCPSCYEEMFRISESDGTKQCLNCGFSLEDEDGDEE